MLAGTWKYGDLQSGHEIQNWKNEEWLLKLGEGFSSLNRRGTEPDLVPHSPYFALFIRSDPLHTNHSWNFPS
jgi:hypothetical protein